MTTQQVDVGIIGSGIAGASLAAALANTGLRVALLDRRQGPLDTARGDHIQPNLQPVLARWGVLDRLQAAGAEQRVGTRWFDATGAHIVTVPVPEHEHCAPSFLFLNHEHIGDILLARACEGDATNIDAISEWSLERSEGAWRIAWESEAQSGIVTCTVLVGADGTASAVRHRLNIGLSRHRYQYPIAVLYGRQQAVPTLRTLDVYLAQQRMVSMIPRTGGDTKVGFPVAVDELPFWRTEPTAALKQRLAEWCPQVEFESLEFGAVYPPVSQQSEAYDGEGAVALIGDARHAMHPARSMGMNTCFRVADQLAGLLGTLKPGFSEREALPLLSQFEAQFSEELAPRLAENHAAGLQMDTVDGDGFAALTAQLSAAAADPDILQVMALKAAGLR